jgi:hypothetical protein
MTGDRCLEDPELAIDQLGTNALAGCGVVLDGRVPLCQYGIFLVGHLVVLGRL